MAIYEIAKRLKIIRQIILEMSGVEQDFKNNSEIAINIRSDSMAAINITQAECISNRTKHFDLKYHFNRDCYGKKLFN